MVFDGLEGALFFSAIIWCVILLVSLVNLFRRKDLSGNSKLLWTLILLVAPYAGLFVYVLLNFKQARLLLWLMILGAIASASLTVYMVYNKEQRDVTKEKGIELTAQKLYDAFKTDEAAANKKYLDKAIELTGEVGAVNTNQDGNVVVDFKTSDPMVVINCTFKTNPGALTPGQTITFKGICTGYIPDANVVINEGVLVK
ncbi:hypothetical protein GWC95_01110 [Sediminibacterium roseum]|uniref:Phospholipase_D-nuclease N-terminal n=1 Tax=Sediminibacterium roseum TaxID=1978412 RepID=A0ABW9ZUF9_9BACT|nr:hypothetical protein [Sediminibacterium roseum]NCI48501.1 hypothetical protein [Sediminibacterium roseum]